MQDRVNGYRSPGGSGELASQFRGLILVRLLVMTALGLLVWGADRAGILGVSPGPPLALLTGIWALTFLFWTGLRFGISLGTLVGVQIALDVLIETLLVAGTGGTASPYVLLYLLTILTAGMFLYLPGALLTAGGAVLTFALIAVFVGEGGESLARPRVLYEVGIHGGAFALLAVLSGVVAERSRRSRRRAESVREELQRVMISTDRIMESMPIGLMTASSDGKILRANQAAREILGVKPNISLIDQDLGAFLGELSPALVDALESALLTRKWAMREEILVEKGMQSYPVGVAITPLVHDEEILEGVIVTFTDLRQLRQMEREMQRSEQLASLGELAAGVAHEIRNPLASISGAVQVLRSEIEGEGDEAELMDLIIRESDRLNRTIEGVLDYTRDHSCSRDVHDVAAIAEEVVRLISHDHDLSLGKTILLEFPSQQDFQAEIEEAGIRQVFFNLARNALESMGVGGILRITGENPGNGRIHVVFRDTGVGIPHHELENVFRPFFTSKAGGTGLGLSIASRIVEGNAGVIRARSTPGMGAAFTVELPANPENRGSSRPSFPPKREKTGPSPDVHRASGPPVEATH
jgi:two-component system sensor histidine kinase PilS (NtrC family)